MHANGKEIKVKMVTFESVWPLFSFSHHHHRRRRRRCRCRRHQFCSSGTHTYSCEFFHSQRVFNKPNNNTLWRISLGVVEGFS